MPRPGVGNPGNKGGGRKSAYQEHEDAEKLLAAFFGDNNQEEIEKKISSGNFSLWDRVKLTAMEGDTKLLIAMVNRVFPEKIDVSGAKIVPVTIKRGKG